MRSSATRFQCFCSSGTTIRLWHASLNQLFENPEQVVRRHAEHRRAEAAELIERDDGSRRRELLSEPVDEMDSVPTAQIEPFGLLVTVLMMYSVLPLSSAACTTSHGTSGCTITRMPGC